MLKTLQFLLIILYPLCLFTSTLDVKISVSEEILLPGMPAHIDIEITNTSSIDMELPRLRGVCFGGSGNEICKGSLMALDGKEITPKEFDIRHNFSERRIAPLPTEILHARETKHLTFYLGDARKPGIYSFSMHCEFYKDPNLYKQHYFALDHEIYAGKIDSNTITINVQKPDGIDKIVFEKHFAGNLNRDKTIEVILLYPESRYSLFLAAKCFAACSLRNNCIPMPTKKIQSHCKKNSMVYLAKPSSGETSTHMEEAERKRATEIKALELVVKKHSNSRYSISLLHALAEKKLTPGHYQEAFSIFKRISKLKARSDQDLNMIRSSKDFLKYMKEYNLH